MIRSSWKGQLRLSLVSVPVQAITANVAGGGEYHFNQLHETCHSRIKYKKFCPIHGEVSNDEIVSGYEYAKGKYVIVDPQELDEVSAEGNRVINIDTFVTPEDIDALYFDGRNYYLVPDGAVAQKPYHVLYRAMEKQQRLAVAVCALLRRSQLVLIRPWKHLLVMSVLKYASQVRQPDSVEDLVAELDVSGAELKLAQTLITASTAKKFDLDKYVDNYTENLTELIEAKAAGKDIVAAPSKEPPPTINLMDALRKSMSKTRTHSASRTKKHAGKTVVGSRRTASPAVRRKSS